MQGKAFKFGDNISTDHIAPGRLFHLRSDLQEFAKHVLEDADENFAKEMKKGDFVVAGDNFGLGSSREHAPQIIKIFKDLILKAYGEKSGDGKRFIKINDAGVPLSIGFSQTEAYSKLFMELATNSEKAAKFVNGIVPSNLGASKQENK